jgi:hypothetical protein
MTRLAGSVVSMLDDGAILLCSAPGNRISSSKAGKKASPATFFMRNRAIIKRAWIVP